MSTRKQPRPANRNADEPRLKLHLHLCDLGGETFHVVTLRPDTDVCFSTNYFHETWHILSDVQGARALARLMWGLSYQKQPRTVVLIHKPHLKPTPFDAEPSDPILLVPSHLTPLNSSWLKLLKHRLKKMEQPTQTIRWQTFGLDAALKHETEMSEEERCEAYRLASFSEKPVEKHEKIQICVGFLCYVAPPPILRRYAQWIYDLDPKRHGYDMDYLEMADSQWKHGRDGEVQIFSDYRQRLKDAAVARREAASLIENAPPELARETVQTECEIVRWRREDSLKKRKTKRANAPSVATGDAN